MKSILIAIVLVVLIILLGIWANSQAAPPMCQLTGTVADIYGNVGKPYRISYVGVATQNTSAVIVPGKSSCSANTDNAGNLPTSGPCFSFIQGVVMQVTVGSGQPVQIQVPLQASVDLSTLILANSDPPSLVSAISVSSGGDYTLTVTNPPHGTVGQAVLGPGQIKGLNGIALPSGVPTMGSIMFYSPGPPAGWQYSGSGTWTPAFICYASGALTTPVLGSLGTGGQWVQFGNMVYVNGTISWGSVSGASTTGAVGFTLPFTPVMAGGGMWSAGCCNNPGATFPIFISNAPAPNTGSGMQMGGLSNPPTPGLPVGIAQMLWYGGQSAEANGQVCASTIANSGSGFSFQTVYRIF